MLRYQFTYMSETISNSAERSTQMLKQIEQDPLTPEAWEELAQRARGLNDPLSIKSLEIIIEGLKKIAELKAKAVEKQEAPAKISSMSRLMFVRLAKAYNSPTLLKEVGLIYLRDLGLPSVALQHFERSLRLGGPEKELRPLSEAAAVAVQRQLAMTSGQQAGHSGITEAQHAKPIAPTIIRKTGKLLMPSRMTQSPVSKAEEVVTSPEPEALPATTAECLAKAATAIKEGHLAHAERLLKKANEKPADKTEMWQAWTNLGQACYEAGLAPRIEGAFAEAIKFDPDELASRFNLALGYHLNDKYDEALGEYQRANQIEANHPKVWCNLGVLYFQMDQYSKAELSLGTATKVSPTYARAWDNLAAAYGAQDKLDEALGACQRALELRPDYSESSFKRGVIYFTRNDWTKAAEEFKRAASLPALIAYCEAFQSMIHSHLEQAEEAEAAVNRASKADSKCELIWMAWNELGVLHYSSGRFPQAARAYGEATMIKPDEPEAWFNLGVSYHQSGEVMEARKAYQQAVDLKQSMAPAWHNLGIICLEGNDLEGAAAAFRQEVNCDSTSVRAWYDLGVSLEKLGRTDEARRAFAKADTLSYASHDAPRN